MPFLCLINYQDKIIPRSSNLILDERGITILGTTDNHFYQKDSLIIVGNGYLSNKKYLSSKLNLSETADLCEIIINGYQSVGKAFFDQLDGSFSFCIIDISNKSVLGIRDHFGLQNLFFQCLSDSFLISNDIQEILNIVCPTINQNAILSYFDFEQNDAPYHSETFFQDIYRVLPAHYVTYEGGKTKQNFYWKPSIEPYKNLSAIEQSAIFKAKLINAVEKNIDANDTICANLSGGLDSSSISSIAKMLGNNINSIYFSSGHSSTDERYFANKVVNQWQLSHYEVSPSENSFSIAKQAIEICKMPDMLFMPTSSFFSIGKQAENLNANKIFTGDGGDAIVAYGNEYLYQLYEQENWNLLRKSIESYITNRDLSFYFDNWQQMPDGKKTQSYSDYFHGNFIVKFLKKRNFKKAWKAWKIARKNFDFSNLYFIERVVGSIKAKFFSNQKTFSLLNKEWIQEQKNKKNTFFDSNSLPDTFSTFQKEHFAYSFTNLNLSVIEQQNAIMKSMNVEAIHPFLDKELIEIAVAVPSILRFDNGLGRGILRHAMNGILPEEVRLRTTKVEFSEYLYSYFEDLWRFAKQEIKPNHKIWQFVEKPVFDKLINHIFDKSIQYNKKSKYIWLANRTIYLALWLDFLDNLKAQHSK